MEVAGDPDDFMPAYNALDKKSAMYNVVQDVIRDLKNDNIRGEHIKRDIVPRHYTRKHDLNAVFKVDLPHYWRLIYGITAVHGKKKALLIELFDHERYNKRFGF